VFKPQIKNESILLLDAFGGFDKATEDSQEDGGSEEERNSDGSEDGDEADAKNTRGECKYKFVSSDLPFKE